MSDDFTLVRRIFEEALDLPEAEREAWVRAECGGREDLTAQVCRMLGVDLAEGFLESPLAEGLAKLVEESDLSGKVVGAFRLIRSLGRGGMGSVYLAQQDHPKRLVALKVLEGLPSPRARRRFEVESEMLAGLSHPGIAQVFEAGSVPISTLDLPYFAMEYVEDGLTLPDYARAKNLTVTQRVELFGEVCDAVQYGHKKGILHRDLKPANLLVDKEGRAKVIDFGIARAVGTEDGRTQLTNTGEVLGTLAFMAPERLTGGDDSGDVASDVYSLGGVLYELLTEARAVSVAGMSLPEAIRHVSEARPISPRQHRKDLPRELDWIVMRAMEAEPDRRYATVAAFAEDLRAFLRHDPVVAGPPSAIYRARKYVRRHRVGVFVTVVVAATLTVAGLREVAGRARERKAEADLHEQAVGMLRISESTLLADLQEEAKDLYPRLPTTVPRYLSWLKRAERVADGLLETERLVQGLRSKEDPAESESSAIELNRWLRDSLEEHAGELRAFLHPELGLAAEVRRRLAFALTIEDRSTVGERAQRAWMDALRRIADPGGVYGGLRWEPQVGLLPLGADPHSGLEEFAHLLSGAAPERANNGELQMTDDSGMVLVLLPGGKFLMGSQLPDAEHPLGAPHVDRLSRRAESPPLAFQLDPFLLSKFEMTQAQWVRLQGTNPSRHLPESGDPETWSVSLIHPVDSIEWHTAVEALERLQVVLPTSAQWEFGIRGGTTTPWWTGNEDRDWRDFGNVSSILSEPIGCYPPNPFGLHDLSGNVAEWCVDRAPGSQADRSFALFSTGRCLDTGDVSQRAVRGASFGYRSPLFWPLATRSAWRVAAEPTTSENGRGLRAARGLYVEN